MRYRNCIIPGLHLRTVGYLVDGFLFSARKDFDMMNELRGKLAVMTEDEQRRFLALALAELLNALNVNDAPVMEDDGVRLDEDVFGELRELL